MPSRRISKAKLNDQQKMFAEEYLIDYNATQAAIRAGYSEKTAKQQGSRLLSNADVQEEIRKANQRRLQRVQINQDQVLEEFANIGLLKIHQFYKLGGDDGKTPVLKEYEEMTPDQQEIFLRGTIHVDVKDRLRALEGLAKCLGMDKLALTGGDGGPIEFGTGLTERERTERLVALFAAIRGRLAADAPDKRQASVDPSAGASA